MRKINFKKALFINYAYPPTNVIASQRHLNISREFAKYFDEIEVLSTSNYKYRKQLQGVDISFVKKVQYTFTIDAVTVNGLLAGKNKSKQKKVNTNSSKTKTSIFTPFIKLLASFPLEPLFYKGGVVYILLNIFKGLKIAKKGTVIFSSYSPLADHIIAYFIKLFKPSVYWICDFRDIPSYPNDDTIYFKKWKDLFSKKMASKADIFTSVSEGLVDYMKDFNHNRYVLYNGINLESVNPNKQIVTPKFTISYTGSLYQNRRSPEILFSALSKLIEEGIIQKHELLINYAGKDETLWLEHLNKYNLKESSKLLGFIDFKQSIDLQHNSNINLLLNESTEGIKGDLTGKLFEYIAACRPVLTIIKGETRDEEMEEIVQSIPDSCIVYHSNNNEKEIEKVYQYIKKTFTDWKNNDKKTDNKCSSMMNKFIWQEQIKSFINKLKENK